MFLMRVRPIGKQPFAIGSTKKLLKRLNLVNRLINEYVHDWNCRRESGTVS